MEHRENISLIELEHANPLIHELERNLVVAEN